MPDEMSPGAMSDASFERDVLHGARPSLVLFVAEWAQGSLAHAQMTARMVRERDLDVQLLTIDVDASPVVAAQYDIDDVPCALLIVDGQVRGSIGGPFGRAQVGALLDELAPS